MEALVLIRKILVTLGLCIKDSNSPHYGRATNYIIFALLTGFLMITFDYIVTHFDDRENALYAIMQFVTFATVWTCYICFANQKHLTFQFLNNIQEFVENYRKFQIWYKKNLIFFINIWLAGQRKGRYGFYELAEEKSHGITKWPPIIFFAAFYGVIIISVIDIILSDLIPGELHPETWYTFYKMTYVYLILKKISRILLKKNSSNQICLS